MTRHRRRTLALGTACALVLAAGSGCRPKTPPTSTGGASNPKAQAARTQAEALVVDAVKAGAATQQTAAHEAEKAMKAAAPVAPPTPPSPPMMTAAPAPVAVPSAAPSRPVQRPNVVIRERVTTDVPFPTEAAAEEEALRLARERIEAKLRELDPPIYHFPSPSVVKNEYIRKDSRTVRRPTPGEQEAWRQHGYTGDQVYVEYDVEVTAEQVRDLRTQERLSGAIRGVIGLGVLAFAGFLFLRLDDWTKGYLTSWLAFVAAGLVGGIAAALLFI